MEYDIQTVSRKTVTDYGWKLVDRYSDSKIVSDDMDVLGEWLRQREPEEYSDVVDEFLAMLDGMREDSGYEDALGIDCEMVEIGESVRAYVSEASVEADGNKVEYVPSSVWRAFEPSEPLPEAPRLTIATIKDRYREHSEEYSDVIVDAVRDFDLTEAAIMYLTELEAKLNLHGLHICDDGTVRHVADNRWWKTKQFIDFEAGYWRENSKRILEETRYSNRFPTNDVSFVYSRDDKQWTLREHDYEYRIGNAVYQKNAFDAVLSYLRLYRVSDWDHDADAEATTFTCTVVTMWSIINDSKRKDARGIA
ncbi:hypothetical protein COO72_11975 [Bifidobacterium callitrichos]|nr:hypothetical protein COO72_11975 [Bifidobacterium callitrichos]